MQRVLIGIVALAALGLVWMVTSPASPPALPAAQPVAAGGPASSVAPAPQVAAGEGRAATAPLGPTAQPEATAQIGASPQPGATVGPGAPASAPRWGRAPGQGIAQLTGAALKGTVRRFYGNLPKSGQVPGRVEVQEVLPPELVRDLNVPPESELLWLGERPVTEVKAFESVLAMTDDVRRMVGVTVRTPDGRELRDYVELRP